MGFFNKLKERLFTLEPLKEKKKVVEKQPLSLPEVDTKKKNVSEKLDKKQDKENLKRRKKQNKVDKYVAGMEKTGSTFSRKIKEIQSRHNEIDENFFDELEDALIMSDISVELVMDIIDEIKKEVKLENVTDPKLISEIIADKMFVIYANKSIVDTELNIIDDRLNVILMVGVNGAGKTTSIAKIANKYIKEGKKVLIAAADTFRAGAVKQLSV